MEKENTVLKHIRDFVYEESGSHVVTIHTQVDKDAYDYFWHHVICYTHGSRKAILAFLFKRFHEECLRLGIPKVWDEANEQKLVDILNRLNFNEPRKPRKAK